MFNITVITIIFINVDVVIIDGRVWRDPGNCTPLPDFVRRISAPAYFARCVDRPPSGDGGGRGGGNGGGDDDDD